MMKWVIGALLAATAWTPAAHAQDDEFRGARRGDFSEQRRHGNAAGPRAERPQPSFRQPQQAPQAQPRFQPRADGGWQGRRDRADGSPRVEAQGQVEGWQGRRDRPDGSPRFDSQAQAGGRWRGRDQGQPNLAPPPDAPGAFGDGRRDWQRRDGIGRSDRGQVGRDGRSPVFDRNGDGRPDGYRDRDARRQWDGRRYDAPRYDNRNGNGNDRWNRTWRTDNRFDWNRYRSSNRNAYRLPRYYAPYGWNDRYRRFSIGVTLSSVLWGQDYWIDDPYDYRLPPAYGPYRWVRYYNDALLVDLRTGLVVDTVYDIFWY